MNTNRSIKTSPTSTGTFRSTSRRLAAVGFALSIVASACTNSSSSNDSVTPSTVNSAPVDNPTDTKITGNGNNAVAAGKTANFEGPAPRLFEVKLSEGVAPSVPEDLPLLSSGEDLEAARIAELIAKLPAWEDPKVLATPFAFPAQSSPPPRTGKTVSQVFPPASTNSAQPPATAHPGRRPRSSPTACVGPFR